jgi:hypothetical protein
MTRRLAALLLTIAMTLAGVLATPCVSRAACAMAQARPMDCCAGKPGISAPSCCDGKSRLARDAIPATLERSAPTAAQTLDTPLPAPLAPVIVNAHSDALPRIDSRAAPPGGTLIAQHTSLLL